MSKCKNNSIEEYKNNLFEAYKNYLTSFDDINDDSKKSYRSYVKNAIRHFEKHHNNEINFYETIKHDFDNTCTLVNDYLNKIKNKKINDVKPKTASNYFSAFTLFQDMLGDSGKCNNSDRNKKGGLKKYLNDVNSIVYSKRRLDETFLQRLRTQDRDYPSINIKFPTRILSKKLKMWFTDKLKESLEEMALYDKNKTKYKYKDLKKIELNNKKGRVYVYLKNNSRIELYTPDANYKKYSPFKPNEGLDVISLDHEKALENIIKDGYNKYQNLQSLSAKIDVQTIDTKNGKTRKKYILKDESIFDDNEFVDELQKELKCIFDQVKLVAMHRKYNSSKGKKSTSK